ncbi:creatininase family protein [Gryllotalpicola reticulitermitis]|uniref:Creatininase family protein n=1 Tax=Gryllotalpicola reticulitermitis TaxID=1184153 RepID=A0ABV8Q4Z3_9MICO
MTRLDAATAPFTEVASWLAAGDGLVVVAFGAHEAHGAHLPLATDAIVADAVARELANRLGAVLLPTVPYGASWSTAGYPGGAALGVGTVAAIALDLGRAAAAAGARAFVIVNGDFGNRGPLAAASDQLTGSVVPALVLDYPGLEGAAAAVRTSRPAAPGLAHGEEIETSLLLHLAPATVRMDLAEAFYPDFPADFGTKPVSIDRFSPTAVFGDPTAATAAKGEAIFSAMVEASVHAVREFVATLPPRT